MIVFALFLAASLSLVAQIPQVQQATAQEGALGWFKANWVPILLVVSEILAFLPAKWSGVLRSVISVLAKPGKKKLPSQSISL